MRKDEVDYSLYLVTDSTPGILGDRDLCHVVAEALEGGVTIVQYRDKTSDTAVLIDVAKKLHQITKKHGVPLLINDRVDVALAVGCEGVHLGQDDMDFHTARKLLGPDAIIGISASNQDEALKACQDGADYLGIGAVFATLTKTNTKSVLGTAGLRLILGAMVSHGFAQVPTVCIGGLNAINLQRVVFQSGSPHKNLSGVAVVSAIVAVADPRDESRRLLGLVKALPPFRTANAGAGAGGNAKSGAPAGGGEKEPATTQPEDVLALVPAVIKAVHETNPLSHNMTNLVVQNFAANVALAVGASPIMANYGEEAADLARLGGALVINMGTVTPEGLENYLKALKAYNLAGRPVIFDPVGAGATSVRRAAVQTILAGGYLDVIKGNEGEIQAVYAAVPNPSDRSSQSGSTPLPQQRGVDSSASLSKTQRCLLASRLAARERNVVVLTGAVDVASDGARTFLVPHGHPLLGRVTGTGCCLGTVLSAACAAYPADGLVACVAGLVLYGIAAEAAAQRCAGPGTFVPHFIDALDGCRRAAAEGDLSWMAHARVERAEFPAGEGPGAS